MYSVFPHASLLHMVIDTHTFVSFALVGSALVIAPGPGQALVITRTIEGGGRAGVLTALGLEIGTVIHAVTAALGLSAVLAASATAFAIVTYAGATYLIVIGVLTLRHATGPKDEGSIDAAGDRTIGPARIVFNAAMTGTLNPKVAVFFLAFLPQFVRPERGAVFGQFLILGLTLAMMGLAFDSTVALAIGRARERLMLPPAFSRWRQRFTGAVLIGLGLRLAWGDRR